MDKVHTSCMHAISHMTPRLAVSQVGPVRTRAGIGNSSCIFALSEGGMEDLHNAFRVMEDTFNAADLDGVGSLSIEHWSTYLMHHGFREVSIGHTHHQSPPHPSSLVRSHASSQHLFAPYTHSLFLTHPSSFHPSTPNPPTYLHHPFTPLHPFVYPSFKRSISQVQTHLFKTFKKIQ